MLGSILALVGSERKNAKEIVHPAREHSLDEQPEDLPFVVSGIINLGNSCFLNALLQAMSSSPRLLKYFHDVDVLLEQEAVYVGGTASSIYDKSLSKALYTTLEALQPCKNRPRLINLLALQRRIQLLFPQQHHFSLGDDQQDADELLVLALEIVEKESHSSWRVLMPRLGVSELLHPPSQTVGTTRVPIQNPLLGSFFRLLQCTRCKRKSPLRPDTFSTLTLFHLRPTLEESLTAFCERELIEHLHCDNCKQKTTFVKRDVIGKLPLVLCIKLMRNEYVEGRLRKRTTSTHLPDCLDVKHACFFHVLAATSITTPIESGKPTSPWKQPPSSLHREPVTNHVLWSLNNVASFPSVPRVMMNPSTTSTHYRLVAVIEHQGGAHGGHFVAYRRVPEISTTAWLRCSDEQVSLVSSIDFSNVYMCFYEAMRN